MKAVGLCDHCEVALARWRVWPGVGSVAECPRCHSSFLRRHRPAWSDEDLLLAAFGAAVAAGPIMPTVARWIRAFAIVAGHYKTEADFVGAKRCEDVAATLRYWQRGGAVQVEAVLA